MRNVKIIPTADIMIKWSSVQYVEMAQVYSTWDSFWKSFQELLSEYLMHSTMYTYMNIKCTKYIALNKVETFQLINFTLESFPDKNTKESIDSLLFCMLQKALKEMGYTIKGCKLTTWDLNLYL